MRAHEIIQRARSLGIVMSLEDGKLAVTPASRLSEELRSAIRAERDEIIRSLTVPATEPDDGWERMKRAASHLGENVTDGQRKYQLWGVTPRGAICFDGHFYKTLDLDDLGL